MLEFSARDFLLGKEWNVNTCTCIYYIYIQTEDATNKISHAWPLERQGVKSCKPACTSISVLCVSVHTLQCVSTDIAWMCVIKRYWLQYQFVSSAI